MISYTLKCAEGHQFDSWFGSAAAYEALEKAGHLSCAMCGSTSVTKSLMAPRLTTSECGLAATPIPTLRGPQSDAEQTLAEVRRKVEENSDYVGNDFVKQARAMHEGTTPERAIYGEARLDQAKALVEDGVPVMPLPFRPKQKLT